jgi:threonine synthase
VRYVSTRGRAPELGFEDVLLTGLARDGGLYVPAEWPHLTRDEIAGLAGLSYVDAALRVIHPFVGAEIGEEELRGLLADAYDSFRHPAVAPLVQIGPNDWLLELFHGPTLAFKDIAMQVLARLMDRALDRRGTALTIVGATSGDTGAAAIEAFRGRQAIDVFILYPHGRISEAQRRQMTTAVEPNVHAIAIDGTFDDCQTLLKALFGDGALRDRLNLAGVNSINWARLVAQIVYYFTAGVALGAPARSVSFSVPTGNFGDMFAGYVAMRMGLPVGRLVVATNVNDILARAIATGRYEPKAVSATSSPSMDIQISSNFERLIFEIAGRDAARVRELMGNLATCGSFALNQGEHASLKQLLAGVCIDEDETRTAIRQLHEATGYICDPHTAVGIGAAASVARDAAVPMVMLATAHAAKFPDAVASAIGVHPAEPERLARQRQLAERVTRLPNDLSAVAAFICEHARVGRAQ